MLVKQVIIYRNQAIAHLLYAYGRMYFDPVQATDIYTKQCAINVNAQDLANYGCNTCKWRRKPGYKKER